MKTKAILVIAVFLMSLIPVYAQEDTATVNPLADVNEVIDASVDTTQEDEPYIGSTPDQTVRYGFKRALERISLAMTFNEQKKAELKLQLAQRRLIEAKLMAKAKNLKALEKARGLYQELTDSAEQDIEAISSENPESDLEDNVDLEKLAEENDADIDELENELDLAGDVSAEDETKIAEIKAKLQEKREQIKAKLAEKREKIKIKYKTALEKSDQEFEKKLQEIKENVKLSEVKSKVAIKNVERLEQKVTVLNEHIANAEAKGKDVSAVKERVAEAELILVELKNLEGKNPEDVKDLIHQTNQLLNFRNAIQEAKKEQIKTTIKEKIQAKDEELKKKVETAKARLIKNKELIKERLKLKEQTASEEVETTDETENEVEEKTVSNQEGQ